MLLAGIKNGFYTCTDEQDDTEQRKVLMDRYQLNVFYSSDIVCMLNKLDNIILTTYSFPLTIGLFPHTTVIKGKTTLDLYHELLPYTHELYVIECIGMDYKYGHYVNIIPIEKLPFCFTVKKYIRQSTIDEILQDLC